jgi:TfoX N-terminal domain
MARDAGLEALLESDLSHLADVTRKPMFGGVAWMWRGHLLCGARDAGILARLGKGNDAWALAHPGIARMVMGGRPMEGWVRLSPEASGDDALRQRLLTAAETFVATLPPK